jgi:prepilin peptidase CpaA
MGAGDVKLMAAVGAIVGPGNWLSIFLVTALLGGLAALVLVAWKKRVRATMNNVGVLVNEMARLRPPAKADSRLDVRSSESLRMPHGTVIAAGVVIFLASGWLYTPFSA